MTHVHEESISDVQDALIESNTLIPDNIDVSEDDNCDFEHVLVESSMSVHVARYSHAITMIEDGIKHKTVDTSIITSSNPSDFSHADRGYIVAINFSYSSESVKFSNMTHHVIPSVFSFSECLELFSQFHHISIVHVILYH